jgi:hypothetical protein
LQVTDVGLQALIDGPVAKTLTRFKFTPKNFADAVPGEMDERNMESDEEDESTPGAGEGDNAGSHRVSKQTLDMLKELCPTNKLRTC